MLLQAVFRTIISVSVMGSVAALIVILLKIIFKNKLSAKWQYYICFLVMARLALPYMPGSSLSIFNFVNTPMQINTINAESKVKLVYDNQANNPVAAKNINQNKSTSSISDTNSSKSSSSNNNLKINKNNKISFSSILNYKNLISEQKLSILWLIGAIIFIFYVLISYLIFILKLSKERICTNENIINQLNNCKAYMGIRRKIVIIDSKVIKTPTLIGVIRPCIIIPHNIICKLTESEIKYILLHELIHYKRGDLLLNWINTVILALHWFNPVVWIFMNIIKKDCEMSCDETMLRKIEKNEYKMYGETLIKLAGTISKKEYVIGTAAIINKSEIKERIIMISKFRKKPFWCSIIAVIIVLIVVTSCLTNGKKPIINVKQNNKKTLVQAADKTDKNTSTKSDNSVQQDEDHSKAKDSSTVQTALQNKTSKQEVNSKVQQIQSTVYKNDEYGFSITFPASWQNKYTIVDNSVLSSNVGKTQGISVYFKPSSGKAGNRGLFFTIIKKTSDLDESHYDSIGSIREFKANGSTFFIGGPLDVNFPENDPEFNTFIKMNKDCPDIIKTIKILN